MNTTIPPMQETTMTTETTKKPDDRFGLCPICHRESACLNVRQSSYGFCEEHRIFWRIGWNLFSSWRDETEADWQRNIELLRTRREVKAFYWPETRAEWAREDAEWDQSWIDDETAVALDRMAAEPRAAMAEDDAAVAGNPTAFFGIETSND